MKLAIVRCLKGTVPRDFDFTFFIDVFIVEDTGGKFTAVSLIPVVHIDLRISPRLFEQIQNDPNVFFTHLGEADS